jgi:hypothetical protein
MSAPQPRGPSQTSEPERRKSPRLPVRGRILGVLLDSDLPVRIREIGYGGFATETVEPLPISVLHTVRFTAKDDRSAILRAESLHCWPSCANDGSPCYVTGFEFRTDEQTETKWLVKMLLEKVTSIGLYDDPR